VSGADAGSGPAGGTDRATARAGMRERAERDRRVRRVLWIEGCGNLSVILGKTAVGLGTGSATILGDAVHSLADLANNAIALVVARVSTDPPDREHPYGHRKFETLAVFVLGVLLVVLAVELATRAITRGEPRIAQSGWGLAVMFGVLAVNVSVATWEGRRARELDSDLLRADARHTASDVLVTSAAIVGWQLAAVGYPWLDTVFSMGVAALILGLAWGLFRRVVPVLVDHSATDPEVVETVVGTIAGVRGTRRVRSSGAAAQVRLDVTVAVDGSLPTADSHAIADRVEAALRERLGLEDVTVHVEPDERGPDAPGGSTARRNEE